MQLRTLTAIGCVAVTLVACGGGSGGDDIAVTTPDSTTPGTAGGNTGGTAGGNTGGTTGGNTGGGTTASTALPASAFQSVDGFIAFVRGLASDEISEPLTLPDGAAPTSGTTEPAA